MIINAMFGKGEGGIEQSFVDYCEALTDQGEVVIALIHPDAAIKNKLTNIKEIKNYGQWDLHAILKIRAFLKQSKPDAVIAHGNRAISLMTKAGIAPVIGVAHNYSIKRLAKTDAAFTITKDLQKRVKNLGQKNVFVIPNMIKTRETSPLPYHTPPVIGTMGRFVKKKGFDTFFNAIKQLNDLDFKVIIGGDGEEKNNLKKLASGLNVEFLGWVNDKEDFFNNIDIFCLPSIHEPFGIVLLEAFAHGKPVITTNSEGPSEIATNGHDAIIVGKNNAQNMADAIQNLINNQDYAHKLANNAINTVKNYDMHVVGKLIKTAMNTVV